MRPRIFTVDWGRWGLAILISRVDSSRYQIVHGSGYVRWAFAARLGPLGLDLEHTFYKKAY